MSSRIWEPGAFAGLLPSSIAEDPTMASAAKALDGRALRTTLTIPDLLLYARLNRSDTAGMLPALARLTEAAGGLTPLSETVLELLAWQFHVDFRETATTPEQLAGLVRESIPWHRIKGTPASIRAALELCGYRDITLEEDGEGDFWATYQLGLSGITSMDDLARIVTICREMQPARCRLWRVYTPDYDFRPGSWSGPLPVCAWSQCWWSAYSGAEVPGIPGLDDDHDLIVSFGSRLSFSVERLCPEDTGAAWLLTLLHGWQARYLDYPAWSEGCYGDSFPRNHGFSFSHLYSFTWATPQYERHLWAGPWDGRSWRGKLLRVDRELPPWRFTIREYALSEGVWSGMESGSPSFAPAASHGRVLADSPGTWSALNAFWGHAPVSETLPEPQTWSEGAWSGDALAPVRHALPELVSCIRGEAVEPLNPSSPGIDFRAFHSSSTRKLHMQDWIAAWDGRRWRGHCGYFNIYSLEEQ